MCLMELKRGSLLWRRMALMRKSRAMPTMESISDCRSSPTRTVKLPCVFVCEREREREREYAELSKEP